MSGLDGDGIDEDLTRSVSVAMIAAARAGEQLARMNQAAARQREARAAGDTVEAQRQFEAHTESARAYFEVVTRPEYLTAATDEQFQEIHRQAQAWRLRLPEAQRALNAATAAPTARTSAAGDLQWLTALATEADANDRRAASQPRPPLGNTIGEPDPLASESSSAWGATAEGADAASTAQAAQSRPAREASGARITSRRPRAPRPLAATRHRQPGVDC